MASSFRLPRLPRVPRVRFPWPVLTPAEKTALLAVALVLSTGGMLRVWERSGVSIGPVDDWESLRALVIRSRARLDAEGGGGYPCLDDAPVMRAGGTGGGGASGMATLLAGGVAEGREAGKTKHTSSSGKQPPARPLDLNTAGERALVALPGVGPSTAKAIVAYRAAHGPFKNIEDLMRVKGIGPKKFEALRSHVKVAERAKAEAAREEAATTQQDHGAAGAAAVQASPSQIPQGRPSPLLSP